MKTITVDPIWAWAIMVGHKTIENRSWKTAYRGPLMIHAGKNKSREAVSREWFATNTFYDVPSSDVLADDYAGRLIGSVDLVDILPLADVPAAEREFASGPYCWQLRNPGYLGEWLPAKGQLGIWDCSSLITLH